MNQSEDFINSYFLPLIAAELLAFAVILAWIYMSAGISTSNAVGTVIRSSVLSPYPGAAGVIATGALTLTVSIHIKTNGKLLRNLAIPVSIMILLSVPFIGYFNFAYSRQILISGISYTTYPYAVQSAIPMMFSAFSLYIIGIVALAYRKRKIRITISHEEISKKI